MSHKVVTLVCSRIVESAAQKAVLTNMADKASDGGEGVYCSKATIAAETELGRATVFRAIDQLIASGLIKEAGQRPCLNGHTVIYDLNIEAIEALPTWKKTRPTKEPVSERDQSQSETRPTARPDQSQSETPTRLTVRPKPSLEPSLNQEEEEERVREAVDPDLVMKLIHALGFDRGQGLPRYWMASDAALIVSRWQTDLGLTSEEILQIAKSNAIAFGSPASGPKTLTRHMQDYAAAKFAPPLQATPTQSPRATAPRSAQPDVAAIMAKLEAEGRI